MFTQLVLHLVLMIIEVRSFLELKVNVNDQNGSCFNNCSLGPSAAFYCTEHFHLKIMNHVNLRTPLLKDVKDSLDRSPFRTC
jgi:hypothetical protein